MQNYKKLGIKSFKNAKFDEAMTYFSLAYESDKSENILFFIMLCSLAKENPDEARMLFEYSFSKDTKGENNSLNEILEVFESKTNELDELNEQDAISYDDFKRISKREGFKNTFENIMFSTKVMISNKNDFLEFVQDLIHHDFLEMGLIYIESAAMMFGGDERMDTLLKELQKKTKR